MKINLKDWKITPNHFLSDFAMPLSIEQKITIFFERVDGWQLKIADLLSEGVYDKQGNLIIGTSESAYAVLHIIFSFFEMVAKYEKGYTGRESKKYFKKGLKSIFPEAKNYPELLNQLYDGVRCGLYHCGKTNSRVFIDNKLTGAIAFTNKKRVYINPRLLTKNLRKYLKDYVKKLQNIKNQQLRHNFQERFDFDNAIA